MGEHRAATSAKEHAMQKISPCLWFTSNAEEAANFYVSVFPNSRITGTSRYGEGDRMPAGTALLVTFELDGLEVQALNGGVDFPFSEAVSLSVKAETQEEIDRLWDRLTDGGEPVQCGWLKDRFGFSWQVAPPILDELLNDPDRQKAARVMNAMLGMVKIDIAGLKAAYDGETVGS
jgi:predicted 3-demethylubiquinone-9 3-methyltransferase (glyoxalase superfamily)